MSRLSASRGARAAATADASDIGATARLKVYADVAGLMADSDVSAEIAPAGPPFVIAGLTLGLPQATIRRVNELRPGVGFGNIPFPL